MSDISYLRSGDRYIAYRVEGSGPVDLLVCDEVTMVSIDSTADEPHRRHFDQRLASFARLITFDRAGVGLSDGPPPGTPLSIDGWADRRTGGPGRRRLRAGGGVRLLRRRDPAVPLGPGPGPRLAPGLLQRIREHRATRRIEPWVREFGEWVDATTRPERDADVVDDVAYLLPSLADDAELSPLVAAGRSARRQPDDGRRPESGPPRPRPAGGAADDRRPDPGPVPDGRRGSARARGAGSSRSGSPGRASSSSRATTTSRSRGTPTRSPTRSRSS